MVAVDPRRALWRRGSYEIVGDWLAPASLTVLSSLQRALGRNLRGARLLDVATGTGTVAIEAARRGAAVVGVDLTDELLEVAAQRTATAGVEVRYELGDFDRLDDAIGDETFDLVTSAFGVIFSPDPAVTLAGLGRRLRPDGLLAVAGWDPDGVFVAPDTMLELLPERPAMPDMARWTTEVDALAAVGGWEVRDRLTEDLHISFASLEHAADQLERWSGGWAQLLEGLDALSHGAAARQRLVEHLAGFAHDEPTGISIEARFHTSVLSRDGDAA